MSSKFGEKKKYIKRGLHPPKPPVLLVGFTSHTLSSHVWPQAPYAFGLKLNFALNCRILYTWLYMTGSNSFHFNGFFLKTSDYTDESRKDETCLQFKMKKHFIQTRKISRIYCLRIMRDFNRFEMFIRPSFQQTMFRRFL